jgi:hypothetical protein
LDEIQLLKEKIKELLDGGFAHTPYYKIMENFPPEHINTKPPNVNYSFWELLEHIKICHEDLLDFLQNSSYKPKVWPKDFWPVKNIVVTPDTWKNTVIQIKRLYLQTEKLLEDEKIDLFKKIAHGNDQHVIREFFSIAEHNAYHFGQFMAYKKVIGL